MKEILPLTGIKIIDFTRLLPGPLGTHLLSELGAEVVKIESPKRMDYSRFYEPQIDGVSTIYHSLNHSKKQVLIDYETSKGYQQIIEEIKTADVLIEQFRPGAMASFKLSFEQVKVVNPNIVYVSLTGYGQTGENSNKAGHDLNYLATTGLLSLNKDEKGKPVIPGFQVADIAGGAYMLVAACTSALLAQKLHKKAQYVDLSIFDATLPLNSIAHSLLQGNVAYSKMPFLSGLMVNYNVYECADKKWIVLAALELKFWNSFCDLVNKPKWKTSKNTDLLKGVFDEKKIENLFKTKTRDEWVAYTQNHDVCLSPVLELKEVYIQNQVRRRKVFKNVANKNKELNFFSNPFKTFTFS